MPAQEQTTKNLETTIAQSRSQSVSWCESMRTRRRMLCSSANTCVASPWRLVLQPLSPINYCRRPSPSRKPSILEAMWELCTVAMDLAM